MDETKEDIKKLYELVGDLEADKIYPCDKCGIRINKGEEYYYGEFKTYKKEKKKFVLISSKKIKTLCKNCGKKLR